MAINRYTTRTAAAPVFYQTPLEPLVAALQQKQTKYDQYAALADELGSTSLDALDADRARANTIVRGYNDQIDNMVSQYEGDYSKLGKDLLGLSRSIRRDFSPGGEAYAIQSNKQTYTQWLANQRERLNEGLIRPFQMNLASQYILGNYEGVGTAGPGGVYNSLQTEDINQYTDVNELASQYASEVVADKIEQGVWHDVGGGIYKKTSTGLEAISEEEISNAVMMGLAGNQDYRAYISQMQRFGADPTELESELAMAVGRVSSSYSYTNYAYDEDMRFDPARAVWEKAKLDAEAEAYSRRLMPTRNVNEPKTLEKPSSGIGRRFLQAIGGAGTSMYLGRDTENPVPNPFGTSFGDIVPPSIAMVAPNFLSSASGSSEDFENWVNHPQVQEEYGAILGEQYNFMMRNNVNGFAEMNNEEKFTALKTRYDQAMKDMERTQDIVLNTGPRTTEILNDNILRNNLIRTLDVSYVDSEGNQTPFENFDATARRAWGWARGSEITNLLEKGSVTGITQPASGQAPGYIVQSPDLDGYFVVSGYNADLDETTRGLMTLAAGMQDPSGQMSPPTRLGPLSEDGSAYTLRAQNDFNEQGFFKGKKQTEIYRLPPIKDANGNVVGYGDPQLTGWDLDYLMDFMNRINNIDFSPVKAEDEIQR